MEAKDSKYAAGDQPIRETWADHALWERESIEICRASRAIGQPRQPEASRASTFCLQLLPLLPHLNSCLAHLTLAHHVLVLRRLFRRMRRAQFARHPATCHGPTVVS